MNTLLGQSSSWSTGGPGKGMRARTTINLMNKVAAIELANSVNNHYSDTGVFGLHISGWKAQVLLIIIK
jgi:processing peptidase subunit alpha